MTATTTGPAKSTRLNKTNRALKHFNTTYFNEIPLSAIFQVLKDNGMEALDIDGSVWSGFLCGSDGSSSFKLGGIANSRMILDWHTMQSGRFEINVYVTG